MSCNCPRHTTPVRGRLLLSIDPLSVTFIPFTDEISTPDQIQVRYWTIKEFLARFASRMTEDGFFRLFQGQPFQFLNVGVTDGRLQHLGIDPHAARTNTIFINRLKRNRS
jgi:hypothetical protein